MIVQTTEEKETTEDDDFIPVTTSNKKNKKNRSFFNLLGKSNKSYQSQIEEFIKDYLHGILINPKNIETRV